MNSKIFMYLCVLSIITQSNEILAKENKVSIDKSSDDKLKEKFGCNPPEQWDLIKVGKKEEILTNVCLPANYKANESPGEAREESLTSVSSFFADTKIIEINERKRTLTFTIWVWSIWEDPRIKVKWDGKKKTIKLPSITTTEYVAWHPFISFAINDMIEIESLRDPIIAKEFRLFPSGFGNGLFGNSTFPPNSTMIGTNPRWNVKIFCDFDFYNYPFDYQICSFRMVTDRLNVTLFDPPSHLKRMPKTQTELSGFNIEREWVSSPPTYDPIYQEMSSIFGFDFKLKRQIEPYYYKFYIPCIAIVITSFLSFIIPLSAAPGRIALIATQFLTLTNIFIHQMTNSPSGSKLNHLGYFILSSLLFVFGTMVEFALVLIDKQQQEWKSIEMQKNKKENKIGIVRFQDIENMQQCTGTIDTTEKLDSGGAKEFAISKDCNGTNRFSFFKNMPRSTKLDVIAIIIFNVSYFLFVVIYFLSNA